MLSQINGPPQDNFFCEEQEDLLEYLKMAYQNGTLAYCRQLLDLDPITGEILNDPIKNIVNIRNLIEDARP